MKVAYLLFSLFLTHSALADFSAGDHVLYPSLIRSSGGVKTFSVGKILEVHNNGNAIVQDLKDLSTPESDTDTSGKRVVFINDLVKEVPSVVWDYNQTQIKQGSHVVAKIGHAAASFTVLFTFENGYAALVSSSDYWDWIKADRTETSNDKNDDHLFNQRPVLIFVR